MPPFQGVRRRAVDRLNPPIWVATDPCSGRRLPSDRRAAAPGREGAIMSFRPIQDSSSHCASSLIGRGAVAGVPRAEYPHDDDGQHGGGVPCLADDGRHRVVCLDRGNRALDTQDLDRDRPVLDGVPHGTRLSTVHEPPGTYRSRWNHGRMVSRDIQIPEGRRHRCLREHGADGKFARRTLFRDGLEVESGNLQHYQGDLVGDAH